MDRKALARMAEVFVDVFLRSHSTAPEELILDFDPTNDPVHGNQEQRFFHGYYDQYCFLPLYVFCGSQLLVAYLRPANIDFRGDSGFCRWRLMRWCDRHEVGCLIGLARNTALEKLAQPWPQASAIRFAQTKDKQRLFGEFVYGVQA